MNKYVTSALAFTVAGPLAYAAPGDSEWLELDREIASLASPAAAVQDGITWNGLIRTALGFSDDDLATAGGKDIFGNEFQDVDLGASGQVDRYRWRISGDVDQNLSSGDFTLEDAYVAFDCTEMITAIMGNHKPSFLRSANVSPEGLLFINRTALGSVFDFWDNGIATTGSYEDMISWAASVVNGSNGPAADHAWFARLEWALGEGAGDAEGALGAGEDIAATIGVSYANFDDISGTEGDDQMFALDVWGTAGPIGFGGEVATIDDGIAAITDEDWGIGSAFVLFDPDTTPWDITGSFLVNEDLELGARYESTDNEDDTTVLTLGAAWYMMGHNAKWTVAYSDVSSDTDSLEASMVQVGVTVGASG